VSERARRGVFAALFVLALLGATGLMASALVGDPFWRVAVQILSLLGAVVFGAASAVCAWRWWGSGRERF